MSAINFDNLWCHNKGTIYKVNLLSLSVNDFPNGKCKIYSDNNVHLVTIDKIVTNISFCGDILTTISMHLEKNVSTITIEYKELPLNLLDILSINNYYCDMNIINLKSLDEVKINQTEYLVANIK